MINLSKELIRQIIADGGFQTPKDIGDYLKDPYGIEISAEYVSHITDVVIEHARLWQNRPLEPVYPFVFMDAIHYWSALNFTDTLLFFHMHRKPSIYAYDSSLHSKKLYAVHLL